MDTVESSESSFIPTRWLQVIRDDGSLKGGSIGKVVSFVIFANQDNELRLCLLYGFRLYTTPQKLLKIIKTIITEKMELAIADPSAMKGKVNSFLWLWLVRFLQRDFKTQRLREYLWELLDITMTKEEQNRVKLLFLKRARQVIVCIVNTDEGFQHPPTPRPMGSPLLSFASARRPSTIGSRSHLSLMHFPNIKDLAKQLTVFEFEIFKKVQSEEFYANTESGKKICKSPNLSMLVEISNRISAWVAFEITSAPPSSRTRTLETAIRLAHICREIRNYNCAMEIHSSLCQASVSRLKRLWSEISSEAKEMFAELEDLLNPSSNFKIYRNELKEVSADGTIPILPYVGTFLRDVVFACDGNPDYIEIADGVKVMNFDRLHMVGMQIISFHKFKQREFPFTGLSEIQDKLRSLPLYEEEIIQQLSYQCEPQRGSSVM